MQMPNLVADCDITIKMREFTLQKKNAFRFPFSLLSSLGTKIKMHSIPLIHLFFLVLSQQSVDLVLQS